MPLAAPFPLSSLAPVPAAPQALTAAPLLAAAIDPKSTGETSAAAGEKLTALLQGTLSPA
ncbi:MAG: hypothetical protein M0D55_13240 [Elusimicrobiota bacterium]|nr:MAG: hypothetical protein M0D55_13240 [Elusimicrobiota bacterium]